jgi:hypothetical protein
VSDRYAYIGGRCFRLRVISRRRYFGLEGCPSKDFIAFGKDRTVVGLLGLLLGLVIGFFLTFPFMIAQVEILGGLYKVFPSLQSDGGHALLGCCYPPSYFMQFGLAL